MHAVVVRVISRFLLLAVVLAVPVLLAVASQAMTREPGPPDLPTAPIQVSFAPDAAPAPSDAASAVPTNPTSPVPSATAPGGPSSSEPGVIRQPVPTPGDDDNDTDDDAGDDGDD